jgi:hypothetical protein
MKSCLSQKIVLDFNSQVLIMLLPTGRSKDDNQNDSPTLTKKILIPSFYPLLFNHYSSLTFQRDFYTFFNKENLMTSDLSSEIINESMGTSYFFSLVRPGAHRKKRSCLKCQVVFVSRGAGNRVCSSCAEHNARTSAIASRC